MKKFFKTLIILLICAAIAFAAVQYGPAIYYRFFGGGSTAWLSERFGEELKDKNELVVFETTITGQETAKQDAWLIGTVQEVSIPYAYSVQFVVDLAYSQITATESGIEVRLPSPKANYTKLTVDEEHMKKRDLLFPLTPERYAQIKEEMEARLFAEVSVNEDYLSAAWKSTVKNIEGLFQTILESSVVGKDYDISVIMDDFLLITPNPSPELSATPEPAPTV